MIIKKPFWYEEAKDYRNLHIYLPETYNQSTESYPVMYFFDGHNLFFDHEATYGTCWGLKDFLDGWSKDIIVVGIECGHKKDERMNEYLPYCIEKGFLSEYTNLGKQTWDWIVNEIKPYIDQNYRTIPFRECTGVAGSSMGGLMSLYGILTHNDLFSKAACVSSTVTPCIQQIQKEIKDHVLFKDTKIYLSWGTREAITISNPENLDQNSYTYRCNKRIYSELCNKDISSALYCQIKGSHCERDWQKQVEGFMNYLWLNQDIQNVW